jgi:phenylpyruvate tautomerase PptA (4-oxalocrotonate tautomerase family)
MPYLEVTLPKTDQPTKARLMERLTAIAQQVAGFEPEIFRVRFCEYDVGEAGVNGRLWDGSSNPCLHFALYSPRLKKSVKKILIEKWSAALVEISRHADWNPVIHICEHPYDNVGAGGKVLPERHPEVRDRKFYYELPED